MTILDWAILAAYFVIIVLIGYQTTKKIKTSEDYNVAGRRVIWPAAFATIAAAFIGGGASIGVAGDVYASGYVFMFAFFAYSVEKILSGYLVAPRLRSYNEAQTVGFVMTKHYGPVTGAITGILSVALCAGLLGAQAVAIGTVFKITLGMPLLPANLIGMGIVVLYATSGGLWAVIQTDVIQFIILGIVLPIILMIGIYKIGGPSTLLDDLPKGHLSFLGDWSIPAFIGLSITFFLGEALNPNYVQRAFSAKDPSHARKAYVLTGVFAIGFNFVVATIGLVALLKFPGLPSTDLALPRVMMQMLPSGMVGLAIAALLAVIMSSASSLLNATTVAFTQDLYLPLRRRLKGSSPSDRRLLTLERIITFVVGVLAVLFALAVPNVIDALTTAYTFWAPTIVIPLVIAVVFKVYNKAAALSSIIVGGSVASIWIWALHEPFGIDGVAPGALANLIVFALIYLVTRRRVSNSEKVEQ